MVYYSSILLHHANVNNFNRLGQIGSVPVYGLGKAIEHIPITPEIISAKKRMGRGD